MGAHGLRAAVGRRTPPSLVLAADRLSWRRLRRPPTVTQVERFSALATVKDNLAFTTAALSEHGVPYAVLDAPTLRRSVVVVTADHEPAARHALAVATDQASDPPQLRDVSARVLRVARIVGHGTTVLGGEQLGCDIEFWPLTTQAGEHPAGTALAPRTNRWTSHLTPSQRQPVEAEVHGVQVTTYDGLARAHALDVHTPVDAVYTWVDGSDRRWLAAKEEALASAGQDRHPLSANASRFASREELRYSLRSLEMYAGWVRHVYLVTNGQVPSWLRRDHPGLTVVEHADIFPADGSGLPTFNSHAIEARLHHIDGLAEQYLYLNDDVFFGRPVAPEQFFLGNGTPKFFLTDSTIDLSPVAESDRPVDAAAKVSRDLIEKAFDRTVTAKFQHVAHPQSRATMTDLEARFPAELATTVALGLPAPERRLGGGLALPLLRLRDRAGRARPAGLSLLRHPRAPGPDQAGSPRALSGRRHVLPQRRRRRDPGLARRRAAGRDLPRALLPAAELVRDSRD